MQGVEQRRALNIRAAYDLARTLAVRRDWRLDVEFVQQIHGAITLNIPHHFNRPGLLRDNPNDTPTCVGNLAHGGWYKPPQFVGDVRLLLETLLAWHQELESLGTPVLIRAPLVPTTMS